MGVFPVGSKGSNLSVVASGGELVADVTGPYAKRFTDIVNKKMKSERVLHGAQDQYAGFRGGATVFLPDGDTILLHTADDVAAFYKSIGREVRTGSYLPKGDISAARAAAIKSGKVIDFAARAKARK